MTKVIKQIPIVAFALALIGISINMFLGPHHIAAGGVSGIGILVEQVSGIDRAVTVMVLNGLMLILTYFLLGKDVFIRTAIGSILLPISLALVPEIMVVQDRFFSVLVGSSIFAAGVAILYKINASSGGTTIPPMILKKYYNINKSVGLLITDAIIVIFNIFVFGTEAFLYAVVSLIITSIVMTYLEMGFKRSKAVLIMSELDIDTIKHAIYKEINRGVTIFNVSGGYTGNNKEMLMVVLSSQEYQKLMTIIDGIDKRSFVIAYNVSEVHGLGFTYQTVV
ncbi:YitT family protein [Erysipelothrix sp. HDW6C]|nr:YitT family protein [Erysipelothrix sp. HDW6C]